MAKSAIEKLNVDKKSKIVTEIPAGFPGAKTAPNATMVVSTPKEVNGIMREVPEGKLVTLDEIRQFLAKKYSTTIACPISTAIFINISARAAEEMAGFGEQNITPYWRTLKTGGFLNDKYPGGIEAQKAKLEEEGFKVTQTKKGYFVENYQEYLFNLEG
jgi:alkylated DNA nucleotide flippase Atl1